jgi:hypothetical protein
MNTSGCGVSGARLIKCGRALVVWGSLGMVASAGGCAGTVRTPGAEAAPAGASSPWAMPTATMRWNEYACELSARNQIGQQRTARVLAYLNLAINNAIRVAAQQGRKADGAAGGAAATVLAYAFPNNAAMIEARLASETAALGPGATRDDFASAVQVGQTAGAEVVAVAKTDRFDLAWTGTVPTGPGKWVSSAQPPIFPRLGEMRPFFLTSAAEFRPSPPPSLDSSEFKTALAEVRSISDHRTTEQLRIAQFWEQTSGSYSAGVWNDVARKAIAAHSLGDADAARVLALAHMAVIDAFIACHDAKYTYWLARPTQVDPAIRLAIGLPNHPSYPGNHGCVSTAYGTVLDSAFPDEGGRYSTMARQAAESRIYAGIHYRFDNDAGMEIGRKVAARALATGLPADKAYLPAQK